MIIDTHCHLDNIKFFDDLEDVIQRAKESGIEKVVIPGADINDLPRAIEICEKNEDIYFSVGTHPYDIDGFDEELLEKYINHPKCVAVGECGLDYFRLPKDEDEKIQNIKKQKEVFISQIEMALKYKKPLIIHVRESSGDSYDILKRYDFKETSAIFHCFNASPLLLELEANGFYFGIGGVVTFKNAKNLVEIVPKIPQEKLLIETDAPYLTPHPHRGKRNEPHYTTHVCTKLAQILDITENEVADITTTNAKRVFFRGL